MVSGLLIGLLVAPFRRTFPGAGPPALIGLLVAATIAIAGNLLLGPDSDRSPHRPAPGRYFPYVFWILGRSPVVLIGLPWVGWMLRQTRLRDAAKFLQRVTKVEDKPITFTLQ